MVRLNQNAVFAEEKFTKYLLVKLPKNDKSKFLALAGYTLENWQQLVQDIRIQILPLEAFPTINTEFGQKYEIYGNLIGQNGVTLRVIPVWIVTLQETRFVTLLPE